ncbi:hypothetical protein FGO68_gene10882 [Halteria grandinella]|uniref:Tubulin/FtsZ GTPase domain-containing protein n=1 Tax=Halteria grandinella TaxID=5974 RepID=A0A8J8NM17_HALGN|nr:hypothetical protein FGO68_gene10882 [Halteria grandinella]
MVLSGTEDCADLYPRGMYLNSHQLLEPSQERLRILSETFDAGLRNLILVNSVCGGTGSGFTHSLIQNVSDEYEKAGIMNVCIYPEQGSETLGVYNTILSFDYTLANSAVNLVIDNKAVRGMGGKGVSRWDNQVICNLLKDILYNQTSVNSLAQILVPFPRHKFIIPHLQKIPLLSLTNPSQPPKYQSVQITEELDLINTPSFGDALGIITNQCEKNYNKGLYHHWYVSAGMELREITDAIYHCQNIVHEYNSPTE